SGRSSPTRRGRAPWRRAARRRRATTRARAARGGSEAARASSPAPRRTRSRSGLLGVRRPSGLPGAPLLLLFLLPALRLRIRVGDELLAAAPPPRPDQHAQRKGD